MLKNDLLTKEQQKEIYHTVNAALLSGIAARVALCAVHSILPTVNEAISAVAELTIQDEIKKSAILVAVNVAKAASKFATKCVNNVNKQIDKVYIVNEGSIYCEGLPQDVINDQKIRKFYLGSEFNL